MRYILILFFTFVISTAFSQAKLGAQVGYGLEAEEFNYGIVAQFFVNEKLAISPSYVWYKKVEEDLGGGDELTAKLWELNIDAHYFFVNNESVGVYGIAGINIAFAKIEGTLFGEPIDESDNKSGLNLGIGTNFLNDGVVSPYFELKYETPLEQVVFSGGVRFKLK